MAMQIFPGAVLAASGVGLIVETLFMTGWKRYQ
jgi:hypothetical protein